MIFDWCVIGAGLVGLATAREILRRQPGASLVLLDKEAGPARHQTGRNSNVVHAGLNHPPGSLKHALCRAGAVATRDYCAEHGLPFRQCGKHVVATSQRDSNRLRLLHERAQQAGLPTELIDAAELRAREPNIAGFDNPGFDKSGRAALYSPTSAITSYPAIAACLCAELSRTGATLHFASHVTAIRPDADRLAIHRKGAEPILARRLVAAAGLQADRIAAAAGLAIDQRIVPFRGEYFQLPPSRARFVRGLVYPVADPDLPFLGVHFTPDLQGGITLGPNAVLGLAREGYGRAAFNLRDVASMAGFRGLHRMLATHRRHALAEARASLLPAYALRRARMLAPSLTARDLRPGPVGIRAQAVMRDGTPVRDFLWAQTATMLHVLNAPSPAATAALPIASVIADRLGI